MGYGTTFFIGIEHITKDKAIAAVENGSELGKELVDLMMNGYARIYKSLLQHDTEKYPLMETLRPRFEDIPGGRSAKASHGIQQSLIYGLCPCVFCISLWMYW